MRGEASPLSRKFGMLTKIQAFFSAGAQDEADDEAALHLAAAVLLVEVAKSDHSLDPSEVERMKVVLQRDWGVDGEDIEDLMVVARDTSDNHVSLHGQIDLINTNFSASQKFNLIRGLWQVACADGTIHHHEELLVRRLADLLYVSHTDFIRSKHLALEAQERL